MKNILKNILKFMLLMLFICVNVVGAIKIIAIGNETLTILASLYTSIFILVITPIIIVKLFKLKPNDIF